MPRTNEIGNALKNSKGVLTIQAQAKEIERLRVINRDLQGSIALVQSMCKQETELKCSVFSFLVHKGLYKEWEEYQQSNMVRKSLQVLSKCYSKI